MRVLCARVTSGRGPVDPNPFSRDGGPVAVASNPAVPITMKTRILFFLTCWFCFYFFPHATRRFAPILFMMFIALTVIVVLVVMVKGRLEMRAARAGLSMEERERQNLPKLAARLAASQVALDAGEQTLMRTLAEQISLADGWYALARSYQALPEPERDEKAITEAYKRACASSVWLMDKRACLETSGMVMLSPLVGCVSQAKESLLVSSQWWWAA